MTGPMTGPLPGRPAADPMSAPRPATLHDRILHEVEQRIVSGQWPPGHRIPSEHELTATYGCSRMTVNKVLTQLARAGMIERRRKLGSFVRQTPSRSAVLEIHDLRAEVEALGQPYRHEIVARARRRSTAADVDALALDGTGPVLAVSTLHLAGERPFCDEQRLINLAAVPEAGAQAFDDEPPGSWLVHHVPWSSAEHRIRAAAAEAEVAARLGLDRGAACLVVERRTWTEGRPVTFVRLSYPAGAHELVARFSPSSVAPAA